MRTRLELREQMSRLENEKPRNTTEFDERELRIQEILDELRRL